MKKILLSLIFLLLASSLIAQPQYYNYDNGPSFNSFPFNTNGKMIQLLVAPGEFNQPNSVPSGNITHFYCKMSTYPLGPATYYGLNIRMGQSTITSLPASLYAGQLDTVYQRNTVTLTAAADTWLAFTLDTPFEYDSTKSLIVQIQNCGITGTYSGYSLRHTTTTEYRRTYSMTAPCPQGYQGRSLYVPNCGIDVVQVPQHFNYNTTGNPNSFPFNIGPGKRIQTLIKAGDFNQPTSAPTGLITHFYVRLSTYPLGPATYTGLNIKFGQTTATSLPDSFIPLTDIVYQRNTVTLTAAAGTWLGFVLDTPFEYDSNKSLVVEIEQCGVTGTFSGYSLAHTSGLGSGNNGRTYSTTATCVAPYQGLTTGRVVNCGINVTPLTGVITPVSNMPDKYSLSQNYPNPFNPTTTINFSIRKSGFVNLKVLDVLGREVATLVNETRVAGNYTVDFDGSKLSSGVYFYRIQSGDFISIKKMMLTK